MTDSLNASDCPYVGLEPFGSQYAQYFFGRRQDAKILSDHVRARPVTVLYGPSGIGKTSLLNVGLASALPKADKWLIVLLRNWQDPDQLEQLAIDALLAELPRRPRRSRDQIRFLPLVMWALRTLKRPIILVFDQFEEYFRYRVPDKMREIEMAIGTLVSRRDLPVHLLVALRDDALYELDQLRAYVPGILDTTIKLSYLRQSDVEAAILEPIQHYNNLFRKDKNRIEIEPGLVSALIKQLQEADIGLGRGGRAAPSERPIELPYLQMALTKIWAAEGGARANALHETTLVDPAKLGGVRQIVRDHVNLVMTRLSTDEQKLCARIFDRLVTGIGSKIAYPTIGLAVPEIAGPGVDESKIDATLTKLTPKDARILRSVVVNGLPAFEIFHDVLGLPILEWKRNFESGGSSARIWVFMSTPESAANDIPAIDAILETVFAVSFFFLLGMTIDLGWVTVTILAVSSFFFLNSVQAEEFYETWSARWRSIKEFAGSIMPSFSSWLWSAAFLPIAAILRVVATVLNIGEGVRSLPENFRRMIMILSATTPAPLPIRVFEAVDDGSKATFWGRVGNMGKAMVFFYLSFFPIFFFRFFLKSTTWFWGPIAYLIDDSRHPKTFYELRAKYLDSQWAITSLAISFAIIVLFVAGNLVDRSGLLSDKPSFSTTVLLLLIVSDVRLWQVLLLGSSIVGIAFMFLADRSARTFPEAIQRSDAASADRPQRRLVWLGRLVRVRLLMAVAGLLIMLLHAALYWNSSYCVVRLPGKAERWASWVYGEYYPGPACSRRPG